MDTRGTSPVGADGPGDDEANPYRVGQVVENGRPICGARKKNGQPCGASPIRGATRCSNHGGSTPVAKRAAKQRVTRTKAATALRTLGYDPDASDVDPSEALLRLVSDKAREVAWWRGRVDELQSGSGDDEDQIVWGRVKHEVGSGPLGPVDKEDYSAELNINIKSLHLAEDQLARYASLALKAGVEQQQVEVRKQEALLLVGVIHTVLNSLSMTTEQQRLVPDVVPKALRAVEGGAS